MVKAVAIDSIISKGHWTLVELETIVCSSEINLGLKFHKFLQNLNLHKKDPQSPAKNIRAVEES